MKCVTFSNDGDFGVGEGAQAFLVMISGKIQN
jgi:hypothetical protein